ncbi:MAG: hypothetical protein C4527_26125 [Candidatus Omnitrophota bacterium]|nr:MAG: hypothetical protein C4527_26125 [Candidatus Omnitrophota bacterium]
MMNVDLSNLSQPLLLSCPTCGVKFHALRQCRRCGTELSELMRTAHLAWKWRDTARKSLLQGRFDDAWKQAGVAQTLQKTDFGELLLQLAKCGLTRLR